MPTDNEKVSIITGAGSGIGKRLAERLAEIGQSLVLVDRNLERVSASASALQGHKGKVVAAELDVRDVEGWKRVVALTIEKYGRVDILWNVAGIVEPRFTQDADPETISLHLDINTKGPMLGTLAVLEAMKKQGSGHIVNVASMAGIAPLPGLTLYVASKFALRGFSLSSHHDLKSLGIAVTCVCPDAVATPMLTYQHDFKAAAITFSRVKPLSVDDVVHVLVTKVLRKKPIEVMIPPSRGWLAKFSSAFPFLTGGLLDSLYKKGLEQQQIAKNESRKEKSVVGSA